MSEDEEPVGDVVYRILIVDDEKDVLNALYRTLSYSRRFKSAILVAKDGNTALAELKKQEFDLVLSDHKMPGMSGTELLAKVKEKYPNTVRILITGYSDIEIAMDAINRAEVHSYIEKPWDNDALRETIYEALKRKSERDAGRLTPVDSVTHAFKLLKELQDNLYKLPTRDVIPKQTIMLEFTSVVEFNKFSFEVKRVKNAHIEDIQIFENKYIITIAIYPSTYEKIK